MRCFALSWLFALYGFLLPAQSPAYVHYGVREGLASNKVNCALQDYRGFIWFGTDKGLVRFDGTRFQIFGVKDGLPDPEILGLFEDSRHRLWISCFSQKPCYMLAGRVVTAKNDSLLAKINVESSLWGYAEDAAHQIWITGKTVHVFVFDGKSIREETFPQAVVRVEQIGNLTFGLGTAFIMQQESGLQYSLNPSSTVFNSIAVSSTRILYVFAGKLLLLEWQAGKIIEVDRLDYTEGRSYADTKGRFWLCPDSKGAICFDNMQRNLSHPVRYLPDIQVNAMLEDRQGTLWFCTSGNGIYVLSPGKAFTYTHTSGLAADNITALAGNRQGQLFAGDDGGNLYKISGPHIQKINLGPANIYNRCRQIICLPGDSCWVANDKNLFCLHGSVLHKMHYINEISGFKTILLAQPRLWYGNHNSQGFLDPHYPGPRAVINRRTTALGRDAEGNIWAGRLDGLYSQLDSFQYNWGNRFPALKSRIVAIQNAGTDNICVVTPDSGLLLVTVRKGAIIHLQRVNALLGRPIENIQSLFVEPSMPGRVWMATNNGVYGLDQANWSLVHFDQHDGLADDDVNSVLVMHDTLWAGTVAGLSYLPLALQRSEPAFATFVTGLQYQSAGHAIFLNLLDSLTPAHHVVLPPDAAMATFNLAGLDYRSQGSLLYECVTTNLLPPIQWWTRRNLFSWVTHGFHSSVNTTIIDHANLNLGISIPSGSYQLKITAITTQGISSPAAAYWTIVMQPYWYNTLWFDLLVWGLLIYIAWRILRARVVYRKLSVAVSELQLQALQAQINPHFVGNSINAIQQFFYPPDPAAASNYIELFTRLLRRTIILSEKHFNSFEEELAYDRDYLQMIKLRFGARFQYDINGANAVPSDLPFPSMLLQPILENATIHGLAPEGISRLVLRFSYQDKKLQCTVTDNGMGYKASRARTTAKPGERKSKGLELLEKKVIAFNQLYAIDLQLELSDLSDAELPALGTQVVVAFKNTHT